MALTLATVPSSTLSDRSSPSSDERSGSPQTPNSPASDDAQALAFSSAPDSLCSFNDPNSLNKANSPNNRGDTGMNTTELASIIQSQSTASQAKRKASRRANTAERRATHNAVERQRRETLNGRFLVRIFPASLLLLMSRLSFNRIWPPFFRTSLKSDVPPSLRS